MRWLLVLVVGLGIAPSPSVAIDGASELGLGTGIVLPGGDENPCPPSELFCNHNGSFENGYGWSYMFMVPPYYGAFAEGYSGVAGVGDFVCGIQFAFSTLSGYYTGQTMDVYVWDSDGTNPNNVLTVTPGVSIGPPAIWPNVSIHDVECVPADLFGDFFVGYWGNWPGALLGWYCAVDLDGSGGQPRTNIAPGLGYPTGWQDPSVVWDPIQATGICAYVYQLGTPVETTSWGKIKSLY